MKIINVDTTHKTHLKVIFDVPVGLFDASNYITEIYKEISGDSSIKTQKPYDLVDGSNKKIFAIMDDSLKNCLFEISAYANEPEKDNYFVHKYHAEPFQIDLMIEGLKKSILESR